MRPTNVDLERRRLVRYLSASPVMASLSLGGQFSTYKGRGDETGETIDSPEQAINVFDFQTLAEQKLPPAHYGYLATGVDDDGTLRANRDGFAKFYLRARRLVDVRRVDTSVELFGVRWETPIGLAPVGSQAAFHADGELATARAARSERHLQVLSTVTSHGIERVVEARAAPVWYQLYPTAEWDVTRGLIARAESAGCPVLVLTVDLPVGSNRNTLDQFIRRDPRDCSLCHQEGFGFQSKPMFRGLDVSRLETLTAAGLTWDFVKRLKDTTEMKVVIKGLVIGEDAAKAVDYGADGIIVSNHGGRAEESGRGTIESLPEVVAAVQGRIPVLVDGGFRRGNDVLKAMALGASAVLIGRPYLWGLASFGEDGVAAVLSLLKRELTLAMQIAGVQSLSAMGADLVRPK